MNTYAHRRLARRTGIIASAALAVAVSIVAQVSPGRAAVCSGPEPAPSQSGSPTPTPSLPTESPSPSVSPSASPSPTISLPGVPGVSQQRAANDDGGTGGPNPNGLCSSSVTLQATPSGAVIGTTFLLNGTLSCNGNILTGKDVTLRKKSGSSWVDAGTVPTDEQEARYVFTQKPAVNTVYKVSFPGDSLCEPAESNPIQVIVRPGVSMNAASGTSSSRGGTAVFSGAVVPSHAGHIVILQVLQGGAWRNATSARLDSGSRYRLTYTRSSGSGPLLFRVAYPTQHADHGWNVSRAIRVTWS